MEAILFIGMQATGKSTFYKEHFFHTHIHINLDMLKTRNREGAFLQVCLDTKMRFVVDNTNPSKADRSRYIVPAKENKFQLIGYYFQSKLQDALLRNENRVTRIPEKGLMATYSKLELPSLNEGFDELWYVTIAENGFEVKAWQDEL